MNKTRLVLSSVLTMLAGAEPLGWLRPVGWLYILLFAYGFRFLDWNTHFAHTKNIALLRLGISIIGLTNDIRSYVV